MLTGSYNLLLVLVLMARGRFLFRREKKQDLEREVALDELFESLRRILANAVTLKDDWVAAWEVRDEVDLPPKYKPDQYLYPGAVEAAYDARYARGLLYQNRWNSQIEPLFKSFEHDRWTQVRAMIERSSATLAGVREAHRDSFRLDEMSWISRAVEGIDEARSILRKAERQETSEYEIIASATFQTLYSVLQLSETMLDGLRREAMEQ